MCYSYLYISHYFCVILERKFGLKNLNSNISLERWQIFIYNVVVSGAYLNIIASSMLGGCVINVHVQKCY
jgi:hypothetical protein